MSARGSCRTFLAVVAAIASAIAVQPTAGSEEPDVAAGPPRKTEQPAAERLARDGLNIDFSLVPVGGSAQSGELLEGDYAEVRFRVTDAAKGEPVRGLYPMAWMDLAAAWSGRNTTGMTCRDRIGVYLKGIVGMRPMIDLNSFFLMVMNRDPSISVIDPIVGITGKTKLYAEVMLKRPGADWAKSRDGKQLYVTMPRANEVAVVDTLTFKVQRNVEAGIHPVRAALQPDERYLWVGNDSREAAESGVTVIDTETQSVVKTIATGNGHHEIAFTEDDRYAFVSNRAQGTVTIIDIATLTKVADVQTGALPIALAYSPLAKALYVADGKEGTVAVVDPARRAVVSRIALKPGLGPLRFTEDGRWAFVVNPAEDTVTIIDASTNRVAHAVPVAGKPFQLAVTAGFVYVRALSSERVTMIQLSELGKDTQLPVLSFAAGAKAPEQADELNIADLIVQAPGEAAVLVSSPGDATVYYYMEGMNAPTGNFPNYGHQPIAVGVVDRTLRETAPGLYTAKVQIPAAGTYDVALVMNTPAIVHCFAAVAKPNPLLKQTTTPSIEYLAGARQAPVGERVRVRFRIVDPAGEPHTGVADARVRYYRAPSGGRNEAPAREIETGIYEAEVPLERPGVYYVHVAAPSVELRFHEAPYVTLQGIQAASAVGQGG